MTITIETPNIPVKAKYLIACNAFASRDFTRYYLNGVFVEVMAKDHIRYVATDGHSMLIIDDKLTDDSHIKSVFKLLNMAPEKYFDNTGRISLVIQSEVIDLIKADKRFKGADLDARVFRATIKQSALVKKAGGKDWDLCDGEGTLYGGIAIDGTYPAYRNVLTPLATVRANMIKNRNKQVGKNPPSVSLDAKKLLVFAKAFAYVYGHKNMPVTVTASEEGAPIYISYSSAKSCYGVLMPMRIGGPANDATDIPTPDVEVAANYDVKRVLQPNEEGIPCVDLNKKKPPVKKKPAAKKKKS